MTVFRHGARSGHSTRRLRSTLASAAFVVASVLSAACGTARAAPLQPGSGTLTVEAYRFDDGESLSDLQLHYLTLGTPRRDAAGNVANAVLMLHGTTGSAGQFLQSDDPATLYERGEPLDTDRFFLVIPDGVGAGASSKPSDGSCDAFPHYGYLDQIALDHLLLAHLGVVHERLVFGTSMGAMETWLWGERYPTDADALVTVAATPTPISGRNMLWRQMVMDAFTIPDRAAAAPFVSGLVSQELRKASPCDVLRQFQSSADYDPRPEIGRVVAPFLAINFADDLLNPPGSLDFPRQPNIHAVMVTAGSDLFGHETLQHPGGWVRPLARFLDGRAGLEQAALIPSLGKAAVSGATARFPARRLRARGGHARRPCVPAGGSRPAPPPPGSRP